MRYARLIHLDHLKYKYISITQTDTKMVARILMPVENDRASDDGQRVLTCDKLLWNVLNINNQKYQVIGEGIFDLEDPLHKSWYQPNANICFVVNRAFGRGKIAVIPMHLYAAGKEKTPEWADRNGYEVIAQLYCWSATDRITECPCSFAVDDEGEVFTNIDSQRMRHVDRAWMQREDRSAFLALHYELKASVKENLVAFNFTVMDDNSEIQDTNGFYYVKCSAGYLPQNRIQVIHGKAQFAWVPLMLQNKDDISIEVYDSQNYLAVSSLLTMS